MASVEEKVKHIIVEQLGVDADEVIRLMVGRDLGHEDLAAATERGPSATPAVISMPRFIGPGCMTMVFSFARRILSRVNP